MPSPFDALDAALSGAIMDRFGETEAATLRPRSASQYSERAEDASRPSATVFGVFSAGPAEAQPRGNAMGERAGTTRFSTSLAEFWMPASQVAALSYRIAPGDLIEFPARAGAPAYSVSRIQPTDAGDVNLILSSEDQPEEA